MLQDPYGIPKKIADIHLPHSVMVNLGIFSQCDQIALVGPEARASLKRYTIEEE